MCVHECMHVCAYVMLFVLGVSMYSYMLVCVCMYLCPYFVVYLKQCIVGVSETCRLLLKVHLFVFVLFMDKHL